MSDVIRHYIDGAWSDNTDTPTGTLTNPANGEHTGILQLGTEGVPAYPFEEAHGSYVLRKEPIGVRSDPPWNYPALQMTEKVAPALAAGCTMVLKPADRPRGDLRAGHVGDRLRHRRRGRHHRQRQPVRPRRLRARQRDQVRDVAVRLRAGQFLINTGYPDLTAPSGGYKQSGNGRVWGLGAIEEYLEVTAIVGSV
ncbi:hypothetical protein GCM10027053_12050 [Intrasporangium mesophilum]